MPSPFRSKASDTAAKFVELLTKKIEEHARDIANGMIINDAKGNPKAFAILERLEQETVEDIRN